MNSEYVWLNELSQQFLNIDYLLPGQTVDERVWIIAREAERRLGIEGFAAKFVSYVKRGWFSLSTPVWTNFGTDRGLPISCFGSYIDDSMVSILDTHSEIGMMTKLGGGTSAYYGKLRPRGSNIKNNGKSSGSVNFMQLQDAEINIISQGSTRRGNLCGYLNIDHGDILEFLKIRTDGDPIQDLQFGVCVPDEWMREMIAGDMQKRAIWARVLGRRADSGYPFILFTGNANKGAPDCYRDQGLNILASNLCTEIMLPSNLLESFVCCLSSLNLLYFHEWKDTDAVEVMTYFLDAVMSEFIEKARDIPHMQRAVRFAERHRALGVGVFGWHSLLQSLMIPFESMQAKLLNTTIFKLIQEKTYAASAEMAKLYGEPEVCVGYGRRNSTTMAIAPTKSSATIIGQASENIEPFRSNYHIDDKAKVKHTFRNPYLKKVLAAHGMDTYDTWMSILKNGGSVQHLDFLSDHEKAVFKTFREISPMEIVIQAAGRQKYIDQGQSLNLLIHPDTPPKDVNALVIKAWEMGIKSLYYQISVNAAQELSRSILSCSSCEG